MASVPPNAAPWRPALWQLVGAAYALGVTLSVVRLAGSWRAVKQLRRGAAIVRSDAWLRRLAHWQPLAGLSRPVALLASDAIRVPVALGALRPAVVLPTELGSTVNRATIDAILVHELAHVARRDCTWQWIERVVEAAWWFHPLVWLAHRRLTLARERACDDFAIHCLGDRQSYSETLLEMASRLTRRRSLGLAMAVVRSSHLAHRLAAIDRSAGNARCDLPHLPRRTMLAGVALAAACASSVSLVRATAEQPPATPSRAAVAEPPKAPQTPAGELSLAVTLLDVDGEALQDGHVTFYRTLGADEPPEPSDWSDASTGKRWRHVAGDPGNRSRATGLAPGTYRCVALTDFSHVLGHAFGEPVTLDGNHRDTSITLRLQPGATATIHAVDAESGDPVVGVRFVLRSDDDRLPPLSYSSVPPTETSATFKHLPPGRYRLSGERGANEPGQMDYPFVEVAEPVQMSAERPQEIELKLTAQARTQEETERRWPFIATGVVRDSEGRPIEGATVEARQDIGWLPPTGRTTTDAEGRYTLHFGPGYGRTEEHLPRAAVIAASKPGLCEINLNRQGGMTMAMHQPEPNVLRALWKGFPRVILPRMPQSLDFTLALAASIDIEVVDERDEPVRGNHIWLMGNELPPLADELAFGTLNDAGEFHVDNVPLNRPWFVSLQWDETHGLRTPTFVLREPGDYRVQVKHEKHPATGLDLLRIVRVVTPSDAFVDRGRVRLRRPQRDVTADVQTDDPLWLAPLPAAQQEQGREILRKLGEANRHWFGRPVDAVKNYQYVFHQLDDKPKTIRVDKPQTDGLWFVHGITYSPLLAAMAEDPSLVVFQLVEVDAEKVRLVYSLTKPTVMQAGNGIEHRWRGYFSNNRAHHGELVIDATLLRPISHKTDDWSETFGDYVEVAPSHAVPRHIKIDHGDMKFDWKFKVYEPGLWLFDTAYYSLASPDEPVVHVDNVQINGQPAKEMP